MGKISPVSSKYIVHATIDIDGIVDRPDIIGAVFGQTEGLLGADLELRELQRSGRIGRIEVNTNTQSGKTKGTIIIPSSLDKAETAIVGSALEIIQRIGPCDAKIEVKKVEDVRISKRKMVIDRAKSLLREMIDNTMPDSQELADEVAESVRVMEIQTFGPDRCAAGPAVEESDDIIIVEGRADVLNLLKHGFKNAIAVGGTGVPKTIAELSKRKTVTVFVDGDRGGNLIIKELQTVAEIDFVTKAPDGKEVEEITKKEIHKALRSKISAEQAKHELGKDVERVAQPMFKRNGRDNGRDNRDNRRPQGRDNSRDRPNSRDRDRGGAQAPRFERKPAAGATPDQKKNFRGMLENLIGTRAAEILDDKMKVLGKVPMSELASTLEGGQGISAVVFDGVISPEIAKAAEGSNVKFLVGMDSKVKANETRVTVLTAGEL